MSIDTDVLDAIGSITGTTPSVGAASSSSAAAEAAEPERADPDVILRKSGIERPAPAPRAAAPAPAKPNGAAVAAVAAGAAVAAKVGEKAELADDDDPLDDKHYTEEALNTPEKRQAARARLFKHLDAVKNMTRAAHRAHGAAGKREDQVTRREREVEQEKAAVVAYDRAFKANIADLQSGDPDRFLTGLHRLSNVGDPAGFWRNISLKLASGGTFTEKEKQQAQADPEIQRRLQQLEGAIKGREAAEEESALEQAKTRNLQLATQNAATPRVVAYASDPRTSDATRDALAQIMIDAHKRTGRPLTVSQACAELEQSLAVHYELSQRADGKTNGEKETTGPEPDAGREPSKDLPPKPGEQPRTIPAQLGASPAAAVRSLTERERREATVQALDASGFFARIGM
jgi:hypothetical protein